MSFVRWQMSRLVSDYVLARLHHWSSAAPDCLPSATELSRSPLLVSGTVCLNMSLPHLPWLSSGPVSRHICLTYHIPTPCDWAVTLVASGHYNRPCYLLTYLLTPLQLPPPPLLLAVLHCYSEWPDVCINKWYQTTANTGHYLHTTTSTLLHYYATTMLLNCPKYKVNNLNSFPDRIFSPDNCLTAVKFTHIYKIFRFLSKAVITLQLLLLLLLLLLTSMPGNGITSDPVAMRMFLAGTCCFVPSALSTTTSLGLLIRPMPWIWVTCQSSTNQPHVTTTHTSFKHLIRYVTLTTWHALIRTNICSIVKLPYTGVALYIKLTTNRFSQQGSPWQFPTFG